MLMADFQAYGFKKVAFNNRVAQNHLITEKFFSVNHRIAIFQIVNTNHDGNNHFIKAG